MYRSWLYHTPSGAYSTDDDAIRVCIIDRNDAWSKAIAELLSRQPDMEVLGVGPDLCSISELLLNSHPDVVIIDNLPTTNAEFTVFNQLIYATPRVSFVLHKAFHQEERAAELAAAGISLCLPKGSSPREILRVVRDACHDRGVS